MINNEDLLIALDLNNMSDEHQIKIMSELGDIILDSAILRLLSTLDEQQIQEIKKDMDLESENSEGTAVYLLKKFPEFKTILEEEMKALRKEIETVTSISE